MYDVVVLLRGNIDLNRNFPDPVHQKGKDLRVTVGQEQPETRAMMNFTLSHRCGCGDTHLPLFQAVLGRVIKHTQA